MKLIFKVIEGALIIVASLDGQETTLTVTPDGFLATQDWEIVGSISLSRKDYERVINQELTFEQGENDTILLKGNGTLKKLNITFHKPIFQNKQAEPPTTAMTPQPIDPGYWEGTTTQPETPEPPHPKPTTTKEPERQNRTLEFVQETIQHTTRNIATFISEASRILLVTCALLLIAYPIFRIASHTANKFYEDPKLIAWLGGHLFVWAMALSIAAAIIDAIWWYHYAKAASEFIEALEKILK